MKISLTNAGKRYNREWIFRKAHTEFSSGTHTAITGPNGSGKSTLLQCIGGMLELSEGGIDYDGADPEKIYRNISFCAPYLELIEEMTLVEFLHFHSGFKPFIKDITPEIIIKKTALTQARDKQIRNFSSGMKQRVKLAQAIFSDTEIVLLDEPCSNLDDKGIELYHSLVKEYCSNRLLIVCSNDLVEYEFCERKISVMEIKG